MSGEGVTVVWRVEFVYKGAPLPEALDSGLALRNPKGGKVHRDAPPRLASVWPAPMCDFDTKTHWTRSQWPSRLRCAPLADVDPGDLCRRCFPDPARLTEAIERLEGREEGVRGAESDERGEVGSECGGESVRPSDRRNEGEG